MNKDWLDIVNRYFEAQTSEEEERLLKRFLASEEAQGEAFDETRAVMGLFAVAKKDYQAEQREKTTKRHIPLKWLSAAAAVLLLVAFWWNWREKPNYYACINGVETTNRQEVVEAMHRSMESVQLDASAEDIVSKQLGEMFDVLNDEN